MQSMPDMNHLMKLAASPAGQKLLAMLRSDANIDLNKLSHSASKGDFTEAKQQLAGFLNSKEAQTLLQQLEFPHE